MGARATRIRPLLATLPGRLLGPGHSSDTLDTESEDETPLQYRLRSTKLGHFQHALLD